MTTCWSSIIIEGMKATHTAAEQARWIEAVLANDETSSDAELLAYFIENGLTPEQAASQVARRDSFLRSELDRLITGGRL